MTTWALHKSRTLLSQFRYLTEHHPIVTNSVLTFHLWLAGDILAQYSEHHNEVKRLQEDQCRNNKGDIIDKNKNDNSSCTLGQQKSLEKTKHSTSTSISTTFTIDYTRTIRCASYGAFVTGPILAVWYPFLDRACIFYNISSRYGVWGAPIVKVIADEFIMDPPFISIFFAYMNICEGGTLMTFKNKLQSEFLTTWFTSLMVWPVILLGTFRYLPVYATAPVVNACSVVWDAFLSHRNALARDRDQERKRRIVDENGENISSGLIALYPSVNE